MKKRLISILLALIMLLGLLPQLVLAEETDFIRTTELADGDQVVFYNPGHSMAIANENDNNWYEAKFPDVAADKWYTDAVIWAAQNGIVKGYDTGKFGPNDKITREQMAVILKTYADSCEIDTGAAADLSVFPDGSKATWPKTYVAWAVAAGMISGKTNAGKTLLDPQGNATRAEVASILMRFIQNILEAK